MPTLIHDDNEGNGFGTTLQASAAGPTTLHINLPADAWGRIITNPNNTDPFPQWTGEEELLKGIGRYSRQLPAGTYFINFEITHRNGSRTEDSGKPVTVVATAP